MSASNVTLLGDNGTTSTMLSEQLYVLRAMFYLLTPNETYLEKIEDVQDIPVKASTLFFALVFVEQVLFFIKKGRINLRFNDGIASSSAGIISALPAFLFRDIQIVFYDWLYTNCLIYELPWNSFWTYLVTFLFVDMMYYWFHRAAHEVNMFWASHQTHHSSEEYNLTTALRQSVFQQYISWSFYLPLALFVRPSIFLIHSHMNLVYQFWIHTEVVDNIGPLEYILNTPSHHRVHHGRNPYCIDKNYAGVLIIWDRMFGTFQKEKKDEELAYGLVHPIKTFDPIYIQTFNYKYILKKFWRADSWTKRFGILFKGPGWVPGGPRLGDHDALPKIKMPIQKFNVKSSFFINLYVVYHSALILNGFNSLAQFVEKTPVHVTIMSVFFILYSLTSFGTIFDAKPYRYMNEWIRCAILILLHSVYEKQFFTYLFASSNSINTFYKYSLYASFCVIGSLMVKNKEWNSLSKVKTIKKAVPEATTSKETVDTKEEKTIKQN